MAGSGELHGGLIHIVFSGALREKSFREYAHVARLVIKYFPDTVIRLIGPPDTSRNAISLEGVHGWQEQRFIEYLKYDVVRDEYQGLLSERRDAPPRFGASSPFNGG